MVEIAPGDPRDISGRVVIITGAGQGIGRRYAHGFADAGAVPVIAELNAERARRVEAELEARQKKAMVAEVDVADPESVARMASRVMERFGRIDALVNNAAMFSTLETRPFEQIPLDEWNRVLAVNTTGSYLCARAVAPHMRAAQWGRIINVATTSIAVGTPGYLHYVTSKAAVKGMTNALAKELGRAGITVNCIIPGPTLTEIERATFGPAQVERVIASQCVPRAETPDDIVGLALFLVSPGAGFVTGQSIAVNGGLTLG